MPSRSIEQVLGIHLFLPPKYSRPINAAIKSIDRHLSGNYHQYQPHITLYLCRFTPGKYRRLLKQLRVQPARACPIIFDRVCSERSWNKHPYFYLQVRRAPAIMKLHRQILRTANKLRGGLIRRKDMERIKSGQHSPAIAKLIKKYGFYLVENNFKPHISLGVTPDVTSGTVVKKLQLRLKPLLNQAWTAEEMVAGLYPYDHRQEKYLPRPRETVVRFRT